MLSHITLMLGSTGYDVLLLILEFRVCFRGEVANLGIFFSLNSHSFINCNSHYCLFTFLFARKMAVRCTHILQSP